MAYEISTVMETTIGIDHHNTITVKITATSNKLSAEVLRIISAIIWITEYCLSYNIPHHQHFKVHGTMLHGPNDCVPGQDETQYEIRWNEADQTILYTSYDNKDLYTLTRNEGYITVVSSPDQREPVCRNILTFKDGLLHSIGDAPAIVVEYTADRADNHRMWFHEGKCYRAANPQKPSAIVCGSVFLHHNAAGQLHRDLADGPAHYVTDHDKRTYGDFWVHGQHYINLNVLQ
jgi:hypothetical protein